MGPLLAGFLCFVPASGVAWAAQQSSEQKLSELEARIKEGKADLSKLRSRESSILAILEDIDREFDESNRELEKLTVRIDALVERVETTADAANGVSVRLEENRQSFSKRARALYKWQRWGSPFVLLSGDVSVIELMRRKRYLETILDHDRRLIAKLLAQTDELARLRSDLEVQREALQAERSKAVTLKASIRREQERKRATLYAIQREVQLRTQALDELERASRKLQELIDRSPKAVVEAKGAAKVPAASKPDLPVKAREDVTAAEIWDGFESGKGRLELPVNGRIIGGFGRRQHPDLEVEVDRKGLDIAARAGEEIHAVARGKVIFADHLSGYGRMVILDHGARYYTVYAHLSKVYKGVGDPVRRGERIAAVGDSGTSGEPRLYFELRKDGRPVDPAPWFKDGAVREVRKASR